jgi:hypothetical protein
MALETQPERMPYRLIITRRSAGEILLSRQPQGWSLPRLDIFARSRSAEQLVAGVKHRYGLEAYCLSTGGFADSFDDSLPNRCAVMEALRRDEEAPPSTSWVSTAVVNGAPLDHADQAAVYSSLQNLNRHTVRHETGPFAEPGWMEELLRWVAEQIAPLGLRLTDGFRQLNAGPTFSLLRIETTGGAVWFKAAGEPNSHELPVSLCLSRLFPRHVPSILAVHAAWNGWLSPEVPGTALDEIGACPPWERVAADLAELQIASVGKTAELLDSQCQDLRLSGLVERIDPFIARMSELMAEQTKASPAPLTNAELAFVGEQLVKACSLLEGYGLPDTLGHSDLNPGNVVVSEDRCVFLDWAEGCVTHPLVTFDYLREHIRRCRTQETTDFERITTEYARPWSSSFAPEDLRRAMNVSPLVAVFAYAVATTARRLSNAVPNPQAKAHLRSLARRMYREATKIGEGDERCLA